MSRHSSRHKTPTDLSLRSDGIQANLLSAQTRRASISVQLGTIILRRSVLRQVDLQPPHRKRLLHKVLEGILHSSTYSATAVSTSDKYRLGPQCSSCCPVVRKERLHYSEQPALCPQGQCLPGATPLYFEENFSKSQSLIQNIQNTIRKTNKFGAQKEGDVLSNTNELEPARRLV